MRAGPMVTVAVVGAGIAGAACARVLVEAGLAVVVLDRGRVSGGRMASRQLAGRPVDTGASYLTAADERFRAVVDGWLRRGLARPWTDSFHTAGPGGLDTRKSGPTRFGAPRGLRSLVEDLLDGLEVRQAVAVERVAAGPSVDGIDYDAVVLAMPDPQAERLLDASLVEERAAVSGRRWEPVLALAAGWDDRGWEQTFDGCFVHDSDVLGWIADDGQRRGDGAAVLVAHSTSPFAVEHLDRPESGEPTMLEALRTVMGVGVAPQWTALQRWALARPVGSRDVPFHLGAARVGLCGDGWGKPKVETAWLSGHLLGRALAEQLHR